jgi:hypothetical protein
LKSQQSIQPCSDNQVLLNELDWATLEISVRCSFIISFISFWWRIWKLCRDDHLDCSMSFHCFSYICFLYHRTPVIEITMSKFIARATEAIILYLLHRHHMGQFKHRLTPYHLLGSIWSGRHVRKSRMFWSISYLLLFHLLGIQDIHRTEICSFLHIGNGIKVSCNRYPCRGFILTCILHII